MNQKNQKIVDKVIKRLLSKAYPKDLLNSLMYLEEYCMISSLYEGKELLQKVSFLKGTGYTFAKIRMLRKDIRNELVKEINAKAETEQGYYEIGILLLALKRISHVSEGIKGIHKRNEKIQFAYHYLLTISEVCIGDASMKLAMKALKTI